MGPVFNVPESLEDIAGPSDNVDCLYARHAFEVERLAASEIDDLIRDVSYELSEKSVVCIEEQGVFDKVYSLARGFSALESSAKSTLIESLCSNLILLNASSSAIRTLPKDSNEDAAGALQRARSFCNAFKIYIYFLFTIVDTEESTPEPGADVQAGRAAGGKGRSRKKHIPQEWDWKKFRARTLRVLAASLQVDLFQVFRGRQPDESLITFTAQAAFKLLENPVIVKEEDCSEALCSVVNSCAIKYGYRVQAAATIIHLLHKHSHLPKPLAKLVASAEQHYVDSSMLVDLLRTIGQIDPKSFERDASGAENVASFLEELADHQPKAFVTNLSLVMCHLDGESYKMRSAIIKVLGTLLVKAFKDPDGLSPNETSRLRNKHKQAMLEILLERTRDVNAYTRKQVLQTWTCLCEEHAITIAHWNLVAKITAGRLEDKSAYVRKSALHLLCTLLQQNPFGPQLPTAAFEATLEKYKVKLKEMTSTSTADEGDVGSSEKHPEVSDDDESLEAMQSGAEGSTSEAQDSEVIPPPSSDAGEVSQASAQSDITAKVDGLEHTRVLVASLEAALEFAKCLSLMMPILEELLSSSSAGDVEGTIHLLILCRDFNVDGSESRLRKVLPLIFSQEKSTCQAVEAAFVTLFLKKNSFETATNLINLTNQASIGDLASVEVLISNCTAKGDISTGTVSSLWDIFRFNSNSVTPALSRGALVVLCMAARSSPQILSSHVQNIVDIGFGRWARDDRLLARYACIALQSLPKSDQENLGRSDKIFNILSTLIITPQLSEECWYAFAEQAINAIYILHPAPESFSTVLLMKFCESVFGKSVSNDRRSESDIFCEVPVEGEEQTSGEPHLKFSAVLAIAVSRFFFVVSHVALKHLVYIEASVQRIRKQHREAAKSATIAAAFDTSDKTERDNSGQSVSSDFKDQEQSISAELGMVASEDAKLDDLLEKTQTELVSSGQNKKFLIGGIAPLVAKICRNSTLMQQYRHLRTAAVLALCKLMAIDAHFCEKHIQLLFTVAKMSSDGTVRSNSIIALGDLALRFPNILEPWMESLYARIHDYSVSVRKNAVLVLSHLILNDMIKVKGYISELAEHLEDDDYHIANLVKLFFQELSKKGNNPIYNLLPDILSRLSRTTSLSQEAFYNVMQFLIGSIKKGKQMEGLVEKLCNRFLGSSDVTHWRSIAYCLSQFTYSHTCFKRLVDLFKLYEHALGDVEVIGHFKAIVAKTKKLAKQDLKVIIDEFEEKILKSHEDQKEQAAAMQKAQKHLQQCQAVNSAILSDGDHTTDNNFESMEQFCDATVLEETVVLPVVQS